MSGAGRVHLTRRGQALTAATAAMGLVAYLFAVVELWYVVVAAAVLVAGALAWARLRKWDLEVSRVVRPARVTTGGTARVELVAGNRSRRSSPPVQARDPFDGGLRLARFAVAPLPAGGTLTGSYRIPAARRGVFRLGPIELAASDPFGLASRTATEPGLVTFTVHPVWERVAVGMLTARRQRAGGSLMPVLTAAGDDFFALREYVSGDDLRRVHWPSSARTGDLIVRQAESRRRGQVTVEVDLRASVHDDDSVEAVVSAAAGLAVSSLEAGMEVRLRTTGGFDSGRLGGPGDAVTVLDSLAAVRAHPEDGVGDELEGGVGDGGRRAAGGGRRGGAGGRGGPGAALSGAALSGAALSGAALSGAALSGAALSGTALSGPGAWARAARANSEAWGGAVVVVTTDRAEHRLARGAGAGGPGRSRLPAPAGGSVVLVAFETDGPAPRSTRPEPLAAHRGPRPDTTVVVGVGARFSDSWNAAFDQARWGR